ncbi:f-box domain containing protein [Niveomyces insectorum RCEF 264]|uniref:F-box domain containing protein n=1 Tax=Niveomyces insectorum RCEF 264 TaxID=1081102 RepID=A0A167PS21_9HYPO|nr:f-box domain containing protein [Niveomyces insectorum RCEF 264]
MSIDNVPDELIVAILELLPTVDIARAVQRLSRRFYRLSSEPKLWLARCRSDFVYWTAEHRALLAGAGRANVGPWKQMYLDRRRGDARSARHFACVLASKVHRVHHLGSICRRGLDAKDFLLAQYHAQEEGSGDGGDGGDDDDNVLARRYYASSALASIHRSLAIEEWCRVRDDFNGYGHLDRALGAFDMFVLHDATEDMDEIQRMLDRLADDFRKDTRPGLDTMTIRQKALALVRWMRAKDLTGIPDPDINYRNVRNCLLGHALTDPVHPSLPIVSSAIFVCLASRLGLQAYCCAVPGHVHCTVLAPAGTTVDGTALPAALQPEEDDGRRRTTTTTTAAPPTLPPITPVGALYGQPLALVDNGARMFLDPYARNGEIPLAVLRASIASLDWGVADNKDAYMLPAPTSAIVLRVALNLEASWTHANQVASVAPLDAEAKRLRRGNPDMNMDALLYATLWVSVLMRPLTSIGWERRLDGLLARFAHYYNEDAWIVEKYLVPLFDQYAALHAPVAAAAAGAAGADANTTVAVAQHAHAHHPLHNFHLLRQRARDWTDPRVMVKMVRNLDGRQPQVSRRYTQDLCDRVRYRVGQVFRHRRFGYIGIIDSWSPDGYTALPHPSNMAMAEATASANASASSSGSEGDGDGDGDGGAGGGGGDNGLPRRPARRSPFYTCLRVGAERQVVAQKNIELVTDPASIPEPLFFLAGRHFKRFDRDTCTFVSNLREFFPDD